MKISKALEHIIDELEERQGSKALIKDISSGFSRLDTLTAGFDYGKLSLICGATGVGLTAFVINLALNMVHEDCRKVGIITPLTHPVDIAYRILCTESKVDLSKIRSGFLSRDDWEKLTIAAGKIADMDIFLSMDLNLDSDDFDALIIDSYQCVKKEKGLYGYDFIKELKQHAIDTNTAVILTSSLDDWELRKRTDKRPILTDFKYYEAALPDLSDLVIGIYRDELYNDDENNPNRGTAEIRILKNSFGPTGMAMLTYCKEYTLFEDFTCE